MKKVVIVIIILAILILSGCQPTPEVPPVVFRGEGLPKDCIEPALPDDTYKEIDIPEKWHEDILVAGGWGRITADIDLSKPQVGNTPVYEYVQRTLTNEDLESLVRYFAGDSKLYKYPMFTKDELGFQEEQIKDKNGWYIAPSIQFCKLDYYLRIDKLMETAEDEFTKEYIQPEFDYPTENQYRFYRTGEHQNLAENEKNSFRALVESDTEYDPLIKASTYNTEAGSNSFFVYQKGEYLSADDIYGLYSAYEGYKGTENDPVYPVSIEDQQRVKDYYDDITAFIDQADDPSDDTKAIADKAIEDLKIDGLSCVDVQKCIALNISSRRWDLTFDKEIASVAYAYTYRDAINDNMSCFVPENRKALTYSMDEAAETVYKPPFGTEQLTILVADNEIYSFAWNNISDKTGKIADNTKILSFEECKENALNHLGYEVANAIGVPPADAEVDYMYYYDASGVDLQYYNMTAYEKPDQVWTVPVWIFYFDTYLRNYDPEGKPIGVNLVGGSTVLINALDGGFISLEEIKDNNVARVL